VISNLDKKKTKEPIFQWALSLFLIEIYHPFISTSTPEGNSNFINASTVFELDE
jgi:hypothetical protein